ncbi:hypothetical protein ABZ532_30350 [Streptomyces sp. NPDC019396]|uniref:hypothetical protein n=1 Tax=Streptomyces sp. NPDC019396 TaxID=3154687 RepID=UPI0033C2F530
MTHGSAVIRVAAKVPHVGLDGARGDTLVLASTNESGAPLPALFHLDLIRAMHQARALDEVEPLFVRAECTNEAWQWIVSTHDQFRERMERETLAVE